MGPCLSVVCKRAMAGSSVSSVLKASKLKDSENGLESKDSMFEQQSEEATVHRIPGRMFLNGSSEVASLYTQQGKKGMNQDAMIVWEHFGSRTDTFFCGVFDGHGPNGHLVAKRVRDSLPLKLTAHWEANASNEDISKEFGHKTGLNNENSGLETDWKEASSPLKHHEISENMKESFLKAFKIMDVELKMQPNIDCFCSGTTAVALVKQDRDLVIGNVGDSRAVLGTRDKDNCLQAVQLTIDLKPDIPENVCEITHRLEKGTKHLRAVKLLPSRCVLKTLRENSKGNTQRGQYLLGVGLSCYKWYQSRTLGDVPARMLGPEGGGL